MLAAMMVKGGLLASRLNGLSDSAARATRQDGVVIKAHGSSDAKAIRNAVKQAKSLRRKKYSRHRTERQDGRARSNKMDNKRT